MESSKENESEGTNLGAGMARAAAREVLKSFRKGFKLFARAEIGSIPRKLPVKKVGLLTDKISTAREAFEIFRASEYSKLHAHETFACRFRRVISQTIPPFARSAVLGTVVFGLYESSLEKQHSYSSISPLERLPLHIKASMTNPIGVGFYAGAVHGALSLAFDRLERKSTPHFGGTLFSHSVSHAVLFSSYHFCKHYLFMSLETSLYEYQGGLAVFLSGTFAGAVQEFVSFYTARAERHGIKGLLSTLRHRPIPQPAGILWAASATGLGFVAFEYGREIVTQSETKDEIHDASLQL